jgi:hypothetical protein
MRDSQEEEVEDKVQRYRTKVEERGEHSPWLWGKGSFTFSLKAMIYQLPLYLSVPKCSFEAKVELQWGYKLTLLRLGSQSGHVSFLFYSCV